MPVTLVEAKNNAQDDLDVQVIDEFRKESAILDALTFEDVVNPAGVGQPSPTATGDSSASRPPHSAS